VLEGREPIVISTLKAIEMAAEEGFDLVEISPKAKPPVCKIIPTKPLPPVTTTFLFL
jgi:translation initiation factor IF-3